MTYLYEFSTGVPGRRELRTPIPYFFKFCTGGSPDPASFDSLANILLTSTASQSILGLCLRPRGGDLVLIGVGASPISTHPIARVRR